MTEIQKIRIDKWLCAVRIFKTRTLATEACASAKVKINGENVKASYTLKINEIVHIQKKGEKWVVKPIKLIEKRVGAPIAILCYEDLTPPEEKAKHKYPSVFYEIRDKGSGRPTKKDRRTIGKFKNLEEE